jgi:hypothetical protein
MINLSHYTLSDNDFAKLFSLFSPTFNLKTERP